MSIDFTGITGVSDDYGVVTQIADASGRVLWKQKPSTVTMTTIWEGGAGWAEHSELGEVSDGTYEVSPGSVLTCWVGYYSSNFSSGYGAVYVNGTAVLSDYYGKYEEDSYEYTITKNITVTFKGDDRYCYIYITET